MDILALTVCLHKGSLDAEALLSSLLDCNSLGVGVAIFSRSLIVEPITMNLALLVTFSCFNVCSSCVEPRGTVRNMTIQRTDIKTYEEINEIIYLIEEIFS